MAEPMKIRANMAGDKVEVKVLMSHEMETGQRKDSKGAVIPAWFIQNVTATHNGKTVLSAEWGPAVAKNRSCRSDRRKRATRSSSRGPTTTATSAPTKRRSRNDAVRRNPQSQQFGGEHREPDAPDRHRRFARDCGRGARAAAAQRRRRDRALSRSPGRRQSRGAVGSARRSALEAEGRPEERVARAMRPWPRARCREGRLHRAAQVLQGHGQGRGPRVAAGVVHGEPAGLHARAGEEGSVRRSGQEGTDGCPRRLHHFRVTRHQDERAGGAPKEVEAYELGRKMFYFRGGPHDFACATAMAPTTSASDCRIFRILRRADAQKAYTTWPAYRVSQGEVRSFQWRLYDCFASSASPSSSSCRPLRSRSPCFSRKTPTAARSTPRPSSAAEAI